MHLLGNFIYNKECYITKLGNPKLPQKTPRY